MSSVRRPTGFSDRLRMNIAAFLYDWDDLQGNGTDPDGNLVRLSIGENLTDQVLLIDRRRTAASFVAWDSEWTSSTGRRL